MIVMGDEVRRTQRGNNNAYCQDNEISWFDWTLLAKHADVHRFVKLLIARRLLRDVDHERRRVSLNQLLREAKKAWHGVKLDQPDWSPRSHSLAFGLELPEQRPASSPHLERVLGTARFRAAIVRRRRIHGGAGSIPRWTRPQDIVEWQARRPFRVRLTAPGRAPSWCSFASLETTRPPSGCSFAQNGRKNNGDKTMEIKINGRPPVARATDSLSAYGMARSTVQGAPLSPEELRKTMPTGEPAIT